MGLELVSPGKNPPEEINVIIEIPKDSEPVKYEVDKETGAIFVDHTTASAEVRTASRSTAGARARRRTGSTTTEACRNSSAWQ